MTIERSDVLNLMHTFDPPPAGFDPHTAPDDVLRQHGFPRRPDPDREKNLTRLWRRAFARTPRIVKAELAIDPIMSQRDPLRKKPTDFQPSGWGGIVVETASLGYSPPEPATCVYGEWAVPEIIPVSGDPSTPLVVGFWVGLDGFTNGQVLQAGTAATITGNNVSYWAWTEWYTTQYQDPAVQITNFPIAPGDVVTFLVSAPQPNLGHVSVLNYRTGQATSVSVNARPGITSAGASAEWIVEGISADLPNFFEVTFGNVIAGTAHHIFNLSPDGIVTNIGGQNGALTQALIASATTAVVLWEGSA